jgi:hypothetical protein
VVVVVVVVVLVVVVLVEWGQEVPNPTINLVSLRRQFSDCRYLDLVVKLFDKNVSKSDERE